MKAKKAKQKDRNLSARLEIIDALERMQYWQELIIAYTPSSLGTPRYDPEVIFEMRMASCDAARPIAVAQYDQAVRKFDQLCGLCDPDDRFPHGPLFRDPARRWPSRYPDRKAKRA